MRLRIVRLREKDREKESKYSDEVEEETVKYDRMKDIAKDSENKGE